ncbi:MAG TPA: hypothetical protein VGD66_12900 [Allosphingosinicella sp.]|jgi:hypothetical protein
MKSLHGLAALGAACLAAGAAAAQTVSGMPADPYARPIHMAPSDKALPSAMEQIARGTQQAADDRAAEAARRANGRARPAKPADLLAGAAISDSGGKPVGTIEAVDADGAIVATAAGKVKVPLDAFGKNKAGLLIGMTKAEFEALVAKATAG